MYTWVSDCCKEEVQVIRAVKDIESPPSEDECKCRCEKATWQRKLCAAKFTLNGVGFHCNDYHKTGPKY